MNPLPLPTSEEMQAWDARAIERLGVPAAVLMESAGRAAARVLHELYPEGSVVAAVGRGNNGGDAIVLLRSLRAWGREVAALPVRGAELPAALLHGWEIPALDPSDPALQRAAVVVDGLLGTGAKGPPREPEAALIRAIAGGGRPVLALDGPSGVELTTGVAADPAVRAAVTVTFGAPKRGLVLFPGREHAGRVVVVEIGLPPAGPGEVTAALITREWVRATLRRRTPHGHKGGSGTLAILAGHPGMGGAAILVAMGALRAGCGKVRSIAPEANRVPLQTVVPEGLFVDRDGEGVAEVLESADALVVGPGMGTDGRAEELLRLALRVATGPLLLDADAVTLISRDPAMLDGAPVERIVMTPHPGEMSRLLGRETRAIVADPFGAARDAAERFGCALLLKGSPSVVAAPGEPALVNVAGHSGIATSGMGDTLAGVIGALLGVGTTPRDAAAMGLFLAGRAAEALGRGRPLLPRDVAGALPDALELEEEPGALSMPEVILDLPAAR